MQLTSKGVVYDCCISRHKKRLAVLLHEYIYRGGLIACEASIFSIIYFQRSTVISLIGPPSKVSSPLFFNEVVAKFAADEVEEERVESVWDSKEDKLSSAGDSEEAESSSVGTKTDGELIEKLLPGVNAVIVEYFKLQEKLLMLMSVHFTIVKQVFPSVCGSYSEIHTECVKQSVDLEAIAHLKILSLLQMKWRRGWILWGTWKKMNQVLLETQRRKKLIRECNRR